MFAAAKGVKEPRSVRLLPDGADLRSFSDGHLAVDAPNAETRGKQVIDEGPATRLAVVLPERVGRPAFRAKRGRRAIVCRVAREHRSRYRPDPASDADVRGPAFCIVMRLRKLAGGPRALSRLVRSGHEISGDEGYRSPRRSRHPAFVMPSARCVTPPTRSRCGWCPHRCFSGSSSPTSCWPT